MKNKASPLTTVSKPGEACLGLASIKFSIEVKTLGSKNDLAHYWLKESINKLCSPHLPYVVIREIQITISCSRELTQTMWPQERY
jgi:hypothetical protein